MTGRNLLAPEALNVKGRAISPNNANRNNNELDASMHSAPTSSRTSMSDEDAGSEDYTVLDGVREMNSILVRQIETLRLKIKVDEKNYDNDKAKILEAKDSEIKEKENEIEDLKESLNNRDERIQNLTKASEEKDRTIHSKSTEIEQLKDIVKQTEEYAAKLQKQVGRVRSEKDRLENDSLYKEQNEEIKRLTEELELLRGKLATMDQELQRALTVIDQQNEKMSSMDDDRVAMQQRFREDLDRASKAMRQEVERMREVMRQNYEEMRNLREQNREMHNDVRAIKEMLRKARANGHVTSTTTTDLHHHDTVTGLARPLTSGPVPSYAKQTHGQTSAVSPIGPGKMVGGSIVHRAQRSETPSHGHKPPLVRESSNFVSSRQTSKGNPLRVSGHGPPQAEVATSSRLSPDGTARTVPNGQTPRTVTSLSPNGFSSPMTLNVPAKAGSKATSGAAQKNLPPICSIKEGTTALTRQPSGRTVRGVVRKGSAVRK